MTAAESTSGTVRGEATLDVAALHRRGLQIIAALAVDVELDRDPAGTTLHFRLPPTAAPMLPTPQVPRGEPAPATLTVTDAHGRRCLELAGDLDLAGVGAVRSPLLAELGGGRSSSI